MSFIEKLKQFFGISHRQSRAVKKPSGSEKLALLAEKYAPLRRNSIRATVSGKAEPQSLTRFGGAPLAPANFVWPRFETDAMSDPTVKSRPLAFLAQFDCREFAAFDKENLLPHTGLLLFFYSIESNRWGFDPADKDCSRVYWFEDTEALVPAPLPADLGKEFRFPALAISLESTPSYPDYESLPDGYDTDEYEPFFEALHCGDDDDNITKLLGWADTIQANMEQEGELLFAGYSYKDGQNKVPPQVLEEIQRTASEKWQLLFQLDTVSDGDFELMFGDCGRIYFWIRREDLLLRRFDRVWLFLQCY